MDDRRAQLEAQLSAYLDDELMPEQRAEVEVFLAEDAEARATLAELKAMTAALRSLPRARAKPDLREALRSRMERRELLGEPDVRPAKGGGGLPYPGRWVAAAAIVLMTGVAGYVTWILNGNERGPALPQQQFALVERLARPGSERPSIVERDLKTAPAKEQKQQEVVATPFGLADADQPRTLDLSNRLRSQPGAPAPEAASPSIIGHGQSNTPPGPQLQARKNMESLGEAADVSLRRPEAHLSEPEAQAREVRETPTPPPSRQPSTIDGAPLAAEAGRGGSNRLAAAAAKPTAEGETRSPSGGSGQSISQDVAPTTPPVRQPVAREGVALGMDAGSLGTVYERQTIASGAGKGGGSPLADAGAAGFRAGGWEASTGPPTTILVVACSDANGRRTLLDQLASSPEIVVRFTQARPAHGAGGRAKDGWEYSPSGSETRGDGQYKVHRDGTDQTDFKKQEKGATVDQIATSYGYQLAPASQAERKTAQSTSEVARKAKDISDGRGIADWDVVVADENARDELVRRLTHAWPFGRSAASKPSLDSATAQRGSGSVRGFVQVGDKVGVAGRESFYADVHKYKDGNGDGDGAADLQRLRQPATHPAEAPQSVASDEQAASRSRVTYSREIGGDDHTAKGDASAKAPARQPHTEGRSPTPGGAPVRPNVPAGPTSSTTQPAQSKFFADDFDRSGHGRAGFVNNSFADAASSSTAPAATELNWAVPVDGLDHTASAPAQPPTEFFVRLHIRVAEPASSQPAVTRSPASKPAETTSRPR